MDREPMIEAAEEQREENEAAQEGTIMEEEMRMGDEEGEEGIGPSAEEATDDGSLDEEHAGERQEG